MFLYIDPGTGSMMFSILIGVAGTLVFLCRKLLLKLKFVFTGGKLKNENTEKIQFLIFAESKRYWNVFKPVLDEFEKRKVNVSYWTTSLDDPVFESQYQFISPLFIGEGNKAYAKLNMANAQILLSTTPGLEVYQWKRSRGVDWYVHIYHSVSDGCGYRMFGLYAYDAILAGGNVTERYLRMLDSKRNLPQKEIAITGITYMDSLKARYDSFAAEKSKSSSKTTVLLAPSWGDSSIFSRYKNKILHALIKTGYSIIIRPHPQMKTSEKDLLDSLLKEFPDNEQISWDFESDNFASLNNSDIMISDFSGVIYDYAFVFNKPVIYTESVFDSSQYDAAWFDEEKWLVRMLPSLGVALKEENFENLKLLIDNALGDSTLSASREQVKNQCWQNVGNAAVSCVDYLIQKSEELGSSKEKLRA